MTASIQDYATVLKHLNERQQNDSLYTFQPYEKQRRFIENVIKPEPQFWENYFLACNRGGKTLAGAYLVAHLARKGLPESPGSPTNGWVIGLSFDTLTQIIQPCLFDNGFVPAGKVVKPFIPREEIQAVTKDSAGVKAIRLHNQSLITFKSVDAGVSKFQGAGLDYVWFDEECPKNIYNEVAIRVGTRRMRIFMTATLLPPEGQIGGISWIYPDIVKPIKDGTKTNANYYTTDVYSNPFIPEHEIRRLESIYPEGSVERRIRLDGEILPGVGGSRAYSGFNYELHVNRHMGNIHPRLPLCLAMDFNVHPLVCLIGQRTESMFHIYHEIILDEGSVKDMARAFRALYPSHRAEIWVYGDPSGGFRDVQSAMTDYQLFLDELRHYPVPIRLKVNKGTIFQVERINAVNRAFQDEYGMVGVEVHPDCLELIADFEQVLRDGKGGVKKTGNPKDPYFSRTHTSDAFGYWVHFEQPVSYEPLKKNRLSFQHEESTKTPMKRPQYGFQKKA